jgi:MFS family permease
MAPAPALADLIEQLGFGPAQLLQCLVGGGVMSADGAELLIIGSVGRAVGEEWGLTPSEKGLLVTLVFLGCFVGNNMGGAIGDSYGRRLPIIMSFLFMGIFSVMSSFSNSYWSLGAIRFFVGLAFGVGVPAWTALSGEFVPGKWRLTSMAISFVLFTIGELYASALLWYQDPYLKRIDWRWLLATASIPSFVFFTTAYFFLYDSPIFLASTGQDEKAEKVLESVKRLNCKPDLDVTFRHLPKRSTAHSFSDQVTTVFGKEFLVTTIALSYTIVVMNFNYYGGLYAFPQIFADMKTSTLPVTNLITGALWEVPGYLLAIVSGTFLGRKPSMMASIIFNGLALFSFGILGSVPGDDRTWWEEVALLSSYYGIKLLNNYTYTVAYVYASEVYPTSVRAMGSAICIASGRFGAMVAPLIFEKMIDIYGGSFKPFFYFSGGLCVLNFCLVILLPETFNKKLNDEEEGFEEMAPLGH